MVETISSLVQNNVSKLRVRLGVEGVNDPDGDASACLFNKAVLVERQMLLSSVPLPRAPTGAALGGSGI